MLDAALKAELAEHGGRVAALRGRCRGVVIGPFGYSGPWQAVFGYDAGGSLAYLAVAVLGLVLVMWLFPRALSDPDWPSSVRRRD